jgi:hypothetical protein
MSRTRFTALFFAPLLTILCIDPVTMAQSATRTSAPRLVATRPTPTQPAATQAAATRAVQTVSVTDVPPTLVTLNFRAPDPEKVFGSLAEQAHLSFDGPTKLLLGQDQNRMADVDIKQMPFWQALATLSENSPYVFKGFGPESALMLSDVPAGVTRPPAAVAGPFMVTINHISTNLVKTIDFLGRPAMNAGNNRMSAPPCGIFLFASAEPRLKPIRWYVDSVECVTDTGKKLDPLKFGGEAVASGSVNSTYGDTQLRFDTLVEGATSIARLRLDARFVLERKRFTLEITKLLEQKETTYRIQDFRVVSHGMSPVGGSQYTYAITVYRDNHDPAAWQRFESSMAGSPEVTDSKNRRMMMMGGSGSYNGSERRSSYTFNRNPGEGGEPAKLTWSFPSETTEVIVPLEFRNVPLP